MRQAFQPVLGYDCELFAVIMAIVVVFLHLMWWHYCVQHALFDIKSAYCRLQEHNYIAEQHNIFDSKEA